MQSLGCFGNAALAGNCPEIQEVVIVKVPHRANGARRLNSVANVVSNRVI